MCAASVMQLKLLNRQIISTLVKKVQAAVLVILLHSIKF